VEVLEATLLLGEKATVLFRLLLENVSGLRRKLRRKLENGTRHTRVQMSNSWFERKAGEENAGSARPKAGAVKSPSVRLRCKDSSAGCLAVVGCLPFVPARVL
jgi:hypothetical protein